MMKKKIEILTPPQVKADYETRIKAHPLIVNRSFNILSKYEFYGRINPGGLPYIIVGNVCEEDYNRLVLLGWENHGPGILNRYLGAEHETAKKSRFSQVPRVA